MNLKLIGRIIAGLLALLLVYSASTYLFNLDTAAEFSSVVGSDNWGRANIRANMGGPMLFVAVVYLFGAIGGRTKFVHVGIFYFISVIIGRVISLISDGFDPGNMRGIVFAGVMLVVNLVAFFLMDRGDKAAESA